MRLRPIKTNGATAGETSKQKITFPWTGFSPGTDYAVWCEVYDVAGNHIKSPATYSIGVTTGYTVNYDANGGIGEPESQTKTKGSDLPLSSTKPTRSGWTFFNWNTKADGTGTTYNPEEIYSADESTTLYAIWGVEFTDGPKVTVDEIFSEGGKSDKGSYAGIPDGATVNVSYSLNAPSQFCGAGVKVNVGGTNVVLDKSIGEHSSLNNSFSYKNNYGEAKAFIISAETSRRWGYSSY